MMNCRLSSAHRVHNQLSNQGQAGAHRALALSGGHSLLLVLHEQWRSDAATGVGQPLRPRLAISCGEALLADQGARHRAAAEDARVREGHLHSLRRQPVAQGADRTHHRLFQVGQEATTLATVPLTAATAADYSEQLAASCVSATTSTTTAATTTAAAVYIPF